MNRILIMFDSFYASSSLEMLYLMNLEEINLFIFYVIMGYFT